MMPVFIVLFGYFIRASNAINEICLEELDPGPCNNFNAFGLQYYWNTDAHKCHMFYYGGCRGNRNRFDTYQQCITTCQDSSTVNIGCRGCNLERATCDTDDYGINHCKCKPGFRKDKDVHCMDVDECRSARAICHRHAWCTNTIGSFQCKCKSDYIGDGRDQCTYVGLGRSTNDCRLCDANAMCKKGVCQCKLGFQGDGFTCREIDECIAEVYPCDASAQCLNTVGSYICTCNDGYSGDGHQCYQAYEGCKDSFNRGEYERSCSGQKWVERYYFDATHKRCQQFWYGGCKGTSKNIYSDIASCQKCKEKNIGCSKCDTSTSYCIFHGGMNYTCECRNGFRKDRRDKCVDKDECREFTAGCHPRAKCTNNIGSFTCDCLAGFKGSGKDCVYVGTGQRVDICGRCHPAATCTNNVCQCKVGYQGNGLVCQDADECAMLPSACSLHSTCINTDGSYFCRCKPGMVGNGFTCYNATTKACVDKWEPKYEATCAVGSNHQSRYTYDYLRKRCRQFWYGGCNGTSRNIFTESSTCRNLCEEKRVDPCKMQKDSGPCQYWDLQWYFDDRTKECQQFYYGGCLGNKNRFSDKTNCIRTCKYREEQRETVPQMCFLPSDKGGCKDQRRRHQTEMWYFDAETGVCQQFEYAGCGGNDNKFYSIYHCQKICGQRLSPKSACDKCDISRSYCKMNSKYNYTCECKDGFTKNKYGECIDIDECTTLHPCHDRAYCTNLDGSYSCECSAGYKGDGEKDCHYVGLGRATDNCKRCHSGADCVDNVCTCRVGFKGDGFSCEDVNECESFTNPCDKNAFCTNTHGSFMCTCKDKYAGNGFECTDSRKVCLEAMDQGYKAKCAGSKWDERYMFDHATKKCTLMWYDGCKGDSRNIFSQLSTCQKMCEKGKIMQRSTVCWDDYDENYQKQCGQPYQMRYYFNHTSMACKMMWHGGCRIKTQNYFQDLHSCQWMCAATRVYRSKACMQSFDPAYSNDCTGGGNWKPRYFYDQISRTCTHFWYGGCRSNNENLFEDRRTCEYVCEIPEKNKRKEEMEFFGSQSDSGETDWRSKSMMNNAPKNDIDVRLPKIPPKLNSAKSLSKDNPNHPMYKKPKPMSPAKKPGEIKTLGVDSKISNGNTTENSTNSFSENLEDSKMIKSEKSKIVPKFSMKKGGGDMESSKKSLKSNKLPGNEKPERKMNKLDLREAMKEKDSSKMMAMKIDVNSMEKEGNKEKGNDLTMDKLNDTVASSPKNSCDPNPCKFNGRCSLMDASQLGYECECTTGISGVNCTIMPEQACDSMPCQNGGTCNESKGKSTFWCKCPRGFMGKTCDLSLSGTIPPTMAGMIKTRKTTTTTTTTTTVAPNTTISNVTLTPAPLSNALINQPTLGGLFLIFFSLILVELFSF